MTEEAKSRRKKSGSAAKQPAVKASKGEPLPTEKKPMLATGLEDYGRWVELFKDHKPENDPPFRRGRIWA